MENSSEKVSNVEKLFKNKGIFFVKNVEKEAAIKTYWRSSWCLFFFLLFKSKSFYSKLFEILVLPFCKSVTRNKRNQQTHLSGDFCCCHFT